MMVSAKLIRVFRESAGRTLTLRAAVVAANFGVMMGLAALLGLDVFGQLVFLWGAALVAGTMLSLGGPLILLRRLTDGVGMRLRDVVCMTFAYPAALAVLAYVALDGFWSSMPWAAILSTGFFINALTCLASVMRALGSVQWSMALRDAGPQIALGVGALGATGGSAQGILWGAVFVMLVFAGLAVFWCVRVPQRTSVICGDKRPMLDLSLWGTSVLGMAVAQMDLIVGGAFLSSETLGVYALLRRVANLVALPVSVATWVSAAPVSKAHGTGDLSALQNASASGAQIAFLPGTALFLLGLTCLPAISVFSSDATLPFAILLCGAFVQVILASGYTVATLCGLAHFAAFARLGALLAYLITAHALGSSLSPITNAFTYTVAMSCGSLLLWVQIKRRLGIDTSAMSLRRSEAVKWRLS